MFIRGISAAMACVATLSIASAAAAQDTVRTRDTMQVQRQGTMISAQARDSLITRLLDSANRVQDPIVAQRLRDSVATLRATAVAAGDTMMRNQMNMQQQTQQQQTQQQQMQQQQMQQAQPSPVTSDQRIRVQKDGRPYPDNNPPAPPAGQ